MFKQRLITGSQITPKEFWSRRRALVAITSGLVSTLTEANNRIEERISDFLYSRNNLYSSSEKPTDFKDASTYNNFYEFGTNKTDPHKNAGALRVFPWTIAVGGEVRKPAVIGYEDLLRLAAMEERIYRLRCVEGWSMVIPWLGFSLSNLLSRVQPTGNAKYVKFTTLYRPSQMEGQNSSILDWPYVEGLRLDEAMHPLTFLAFGMYGQYLPNQNGAPVRLVVPWKYGFKSIKSIVSIEFTETEPETTWMKAAPREYGFYSNVNPSVRHPRWSQAKERRIGEFRKRKTLMFNGYGTEVAQLYSGMDLGKFY